MIDVTTFDPTVETDTPPMFSMGLLAPHDDQVADAPWPGWFSPDDDGDGGHSDR